MENAQSQLGWSEAQWSAVSQAVTEAFTKASVAGAVLPCYGPLAGSLETVPKQELKESSQSNTDIVTVDDAGTLSLTTLTVFVHLSNQQVQDENVGSALVAFRRAANKLAQLEDAIVFQGRAPTKSLFGIAGGDASAKGLVDSAPQTVSVPSAAPPQKQAGTPSPDYGHSLVTAVANAVAHLEKQGYPAPFACVLGPDVFTAAHTAYEDSLVMPVDRITPIVGAPLLRSGNLPPTVGLVISLAGDPIDLAVATAPKAQFLQVGTDAKYIFRVYERFALRIKDANSIIKLELK
jgi:uncharacterized linocin/CFP29 family protein